MFNTQTAVSEPADRTGPHAKRNPWASEWGTIRNPGAQWATDLLLDPTASLADCMKLTQCKRCGPMVMRFCQHVFPFLSDFQSHGVAPATVLRFNFDSGSGWWSASSMPQVGARTHSLDEVVWHEWLFRCLAATIIVQLIALEAQLETWGPTAMTVLVVCYVHRLARPLAVYRR